MASPRLTPFAILPQRIRRSSSLLATKRYGLVASLQRKYRTSDLQRPHLTSVQRSMAITPSAVQRSEAGWAPARMIWSGLPTAAPVEAAVAPPLQRAMSTPGPSAHRVSPAQPSDPIRPPPPSAQRPAPPDQVATPAEADPLAGLSPDDDLWQRLFPTRPSFAETVVSRQPARRQPTRRPPPPVVPSKLPKTRTWEVKPGQQVYPDVMPTSEIASPSPESPSAEPSEVSPTEGDAEIEVIRPRRGPPARERPGAPVMPAEESAPTAPRATARSRERPKTQPAPSIAPDAVPAAPSAAVFRQPDLPTRARDEQPDHHAAPASIAPQEEEGSELSSPPPTSAVDQATPAPEAQKEAPPTAAQPEIAPRPESIVRAAPAVPTEHLVQPSPEPTAAPRRESTVQVPAPAPFARLAAPSVGRQLEAAPPVSTEADGEVLAASDPDAQLDAMPDVAPAPDVTPAPDAAPTSAVDQPGVMPVAISAETIEPPLADDPSRGAEQVHAAHAPPGAVDRADAPTLARQPAVRVEPPRARTAEPSAPSDQAPQAPGQPGQTVAEEEPPSVQLAPAEDPQATERLPDSVDSPGVTEMTGDAPVDLAADAAAPVGAALTMAPEQPGAPTPPVARERETVFPSAAAETESARPAEITPAESGLEPGVGIETEIASQPKSTSATIPPPQAPAPPRTHRPAIQAGHERPATQVPVAAEMAEPAPGPPVARATPDRAPGPSVRVEAPSAAVAREPAQEAPAATAPTRGTVARVEAEPPVQEPAVAEPDQVSPAPEGQPDVVALEGPPDVVAPEGPPHVATSRGARQPASPQVIHPVSQPEGRPAAAAMVPQVARSTIKVTPPLRTVQQAPIATKPASLPLAAPVRPLSIGTSPMQLWPEATSGTQPPTVASDDLAELPLHSPPRAAPVQRTVEAGSVRTLSGQTRQEAQPRSVQEPEGEEGQEEADIPALAEKVYRVLKRRLLLDRERFWGR